MKVSTPYQLAVVSFTHEQFMFKNTTRSNNRLDTVISQLYDMLSDKGTIVYFVPRPIFSAGHVSEVRRCQCVLGEVIRDPYPLCRIQAYEQYVHHFCVYSLR